MSAAVWNFDTSIVMRFLVGVPVAQFRRASNFLDEKIAADDSVLVSDLVLSEAYFALQSFYAISKEKAILLLAKFSATPGIILSDHALAVLALPNLASTKPGFVDRLIHGESLACGHTLVTFEKAAKKLPGTVVL